MMCSIAVIDYNEEPQSNTNLEAICYNHTNREAMYDTDDQPTYLDMQAKDPVKQVWLVVRLCDL